MVVRQYDLRRFLGEYPSWIAALSTISLTTLAYFQVIPLVNALLLSLLIVIFSLVYHFGSLKRRRKERALASLRDAIDRYLVVTNPEETSSALAIINMLTTSLSIDDPVRRERADSTAVIHNIIRTLLSDYMAECKLALTEEQLRMITVEQIKEQEDRVWRAIDWYHKHVVNQIFEPSFKPFVTQDPQMAPLLPKFCMRYNRAIDMLESARKTANSDCDLNLDTDLDSLRISV
jgi:hypothetical protein